MLKCRFLVLLNSLVSIEVMDVFGENSEVGR